MKAPLNLAQTHPRAFLPLAAFGGSVIVERFIHVVLLVIAS